MFVSDRSCLFRRVFRMTRSYISVFQDIIIFILKNLLNFLCPEAYIGFILHIDLITKRVLGLVYQTRDTQKTPLSIYWFQLQNPLNFTTRHPTTQALFVAF